MLVNSAISHYNRFFKSRISFHTIHIKKIVLPTTFVLFTVCLVIFSKSNLVAAKSGLKLWANNVVPSLLPFFIATNLLKHTTVINYVSKLFNKIMKPIFNVPGESTYAFILGLISGCPVGAKIVTDLRNESLCSQDEGNRMLCFTNNSGPLFIIGTVGITMFSNSTIGLLLLLTHILSAISVGIVLGIVSRIKKNNFEYSLSNKSLKKYTENFANNSSNNLSKEICNFSNLGEILASSIWDSFKTVIMIGGFIVIFSVVISILNKSKVLEILSCLLFPIFKLFHVDTCFASSILSGIFELTNGISLVSNIANKSISTNIILCAFLLGFGGISVMLQVLSIISKSDLSIKKYIYGKILQGIFAATYTYILLNLIPMLNFNL